MISLNPQYAINSKVSAEIQRPIRINEEQKDSLDPISVYPKFKSAMSKPLSDYSREIFLPGVEDIEDNTVSILEPNQGFINSYMVGLNHEMARELYWRGYPTDQRGSYFRQFWDVTAAVQKEKLTSSMNIEDIVEKYYDIPEIHTWRNSALEKIHGNAAGGHMTVLLIKGELLRRYPGTVIYAVKAISKPNDPEKNKPILPPAENEEIIEPIFRGTISPDITYLGFNESKEDLRGNYENDHDHPNAIPDPGYFFILQEQPSEPRFGIDEGTGSLPNPGLLMSWDDLSWDYVTLSDSSNSYVDLAKGPLKDKVIANVKWGSHAADLAYILLQKRFRIAIHTREML
jgi:hypothetical protein